jgi:hypothetical protein
MKDQQKSVYVKSVPAISPDQIGDGTVYRSLMRWGWHKIRFGDCGFNRAIS